MLSAGGLRLVLSGFLVCALVLLLPQCFGGAAMAGIIDPGTVYIYSNLQNESNNITGTNQAILPSPVWAPTGAGYEWISYGNTGCNLFVPTTGLCTAGPDNPPAVTGTITGENPVSPTAIFYKTFTATTDVSGILNIWADDTATVWLVDEVVTSGDGSGGQMLIEANPVLGSNCANGPIGCLPTANAAIPLTLSAGTYTLVIDAYQLVGGSPFGVMYAGVLTSGAAIPEPASYMLMGLGLAGLGTLMRRRRRP